MAISGNLGGGASPSKELAFNMKLIGHHELNGNGNVGEGISIQKLRDGRRILWVAHESAPTNFTGIDVTDPRAPKVVVQTALPHSRVRSNSLDVVGDVMAVAYQTRDFGGTPAGFELFDISRPEEPKSISFFDCSGPHSRANHQGWFGDGEFVQFVSTEFHRWGAAIREIGMTPDCFSPRYPLPTFLLPPVSQSSRPSTTAPARNMPWIASPHITWRSS